MGFTPDYNRDLAFAEMAMGNNTFNFGGADYPCIPSVATEERQNEVGGFEVIRTLTLTVRVNVFSDLILPVSTDLITYKTKSYSVDRVIPDASNTFLNLVCVDANEGI